MNGKITKKLNKVFRVDNSLENRKLFNIIYTILDSILITCLVFVLVGFIFIHTANLKPNTNVVPSNAQNYSEYLRIKMINLTQYYQKVLSEKNVSGFYKINCLKSANSNFSISTNGIASIEQTIFNITLPEINYHSNYTNLYCSFVSVKPVDYFTYANNNLPQ